jgi:tRNA pseudouridine38-40 synthase
MRNVSLDVSYDGTSYSGWQIQNNALTIQGVIEAGLATVVKEKVRITYAGRTDAGVHALGQVIAFKTDTSMTGEQFKYALNALLPQDIRVMEAHEASLSFHPRYSALRRWYRYIIWNGRDAVPFFNNYALWIKRSVDISRFETYCRMIIGTHNFTSFATVGTHENPIRRIFECAMKKKGDFIVFDIIANSFLRKMVRTIIGTFLELEREKVSPKAVDEILRAEDRRIAGETAFAGGLYLAKVFY